MMMRLRGIVGAAAGIAAFLAAVAAFNWISVTGPAREVVGRPGNGSVDAWAYHRWGVVPGDIVFDLRGVAPGASAADVTRVLFQFAAEVADSGFDRVFLAWRGEERFLLDGGHFRTIGREYGVQNPIYTLRTLPQNLMTPDGSPAFGMWTGGWLGTALRQMEDVSEFHRRWFLDDALAGTSGIW